VIIVLSYDHDALAGGLHRAKLGVSQPYVAWLESGEKSPTLATLA
jgi:predicted transcriptional regulator